jgi:hypothetical protein
VGLITRTIAFSLVLLAFLPASTFAHKKDSGSQVLRWSESQPGCTFSRDNDGKYRYALWSENFGVILAVDSQELQLTRKRGERFFSVHLTLRNRGSNPLVVDPGKATLEFMKHSKVVQPALDPEEFAQKAQSDVDEI